MKETLAGKVRAAAQELGRGGREFTVNQLAIDKLDLLTDKEKKPVRAVFQDMLDRGEFVKVRPGVYRLGEQNSKPKLRDVMWDLLRHRGSITVEDLIELAGVSPEYAREWLEMLVRRGLARKSDRHGPHGTSTWIIIRNPVEPPRDHEKAEKLRALRARQKAAIAAANSALESVYKSALEARMAINDLGSALEQVEKEDQ